MSHKHDDEAAFRGHVRDASAGVVDARAALLQSLNNARQHAVLNNAEIMLAIDGLIVARLRLFAAEPKL